MKFGSINYSRNSRGSRLGGGRLLWRTAITRSTLTRCSRPFMKWFWRYGGARHKLPAWEDIGTRHLGQRAQDENPGDAGSISGISTLSAFKASSRIREHAAARATVEGIAPKRLHR